MSQHQHKDDDKESCVVLLPSIIMVRSDCVGGGKREMVVVITTKDISILHVKNETILVRIMQIFQKGREMVHIFEDFTTCTYVADCCCTQQHEQQQP